MPETDKLQHKTEWTNVVAPATSIVTISTSESKAIEHNEDAIDDLDFDILPNGLVNLDEDLT